jgi:ketosteroid isomerase-like protein
MKSFRLIPMLALASCVASLPLGAQAAPRVSGILPANDLAALEAIRRNVWIDWFSGDTAGLRRVLTPELVAMSPDGAHWQSLDETLAGSARFKASGAQFVAVKFDSTTVHRFGDVVAMFSHYAVTTESGGTRQVLAGRATEVFVRRDGRWVHTSWHLDTR